MHVASRTLLIFARREIRPFARRFVMKSARCCPIWCPATGPAPYFLSRLPPFKTPARPAPSSDPPRREGPPTCKGQPAGGGDSYVNLPILSLRPSQANAAVAPIQTPTACDQSIGVHL